MNTLSKFIAAAMISYVSTIIPTLAQKPTGGDEQGCKLNLNLAEEKYKNGQIEEVQSLIKPCVEGKSNFNKQDKIRAYKLLTITYLYLNEEEEASKNMQKLLNLNPEYIIDPNVDPSEFVDLYNQFRHHPIAIIGLKAGVNSTMVNVIDNFGQDDIDRSLGTYTAKIGYRVSFTSEFLITPLLSLETGLSYSKSNFEYSNRQFSYSNVSVEESFSTLSIPLHTRFSYTKRDLRFYLQLGAKVNYLVSSSATLVRIDSLNEELGYQSVVGPAEDLSDQKAKLFFSLQSAIGGYWKNVVGNGYLMMEIGYSYGLSNLIEPDKRYANTNLINKYNYIPNDFSINQFTVEIGYGIPIYRPKKLKKKKSNIL
ncbi:porin family protein [Reichenbachiella versicolor]|uniref:porin family protein n=1 Tax=Reichenbachiella versicolor TaxID=1821036 RepID=UPI000D6E3DD4|nr:porin family protein [Reichenbachiella versicolor]